MTCGSASWHSRLLTVWVCPPKTWLRDLVSVHGQGGSAGEESSHVASRSHIPHPRNTVPTTRYQDIQRGMQRKRVHAR